MYELHNKITACEKHIHHLQKSLKRNEKSDKATINQIKSKLNEYEQNLASLKRSEQSINKERNDRQRKSNIFWNNNFSLLNGLFITIIISFLFSSVIAN